MNQDPLLDLDHAGRIASIRSAMEAEGLEQLLVSSLHNIRWLTGFSGSNAVVLLGFDGLVLVTDGRYDELASSCLDQLVAQGDTTGMLCIARTGVEEVMAKALPPRGIVGFDSANVTVDAHRRLVDAFGPDRLVGASAIVGVARQRKEPGEVQRIEAAAEIADAAFGRLLARLEPGQTERELAARLNYEMMTGGADGLSFDTIVGSGPNGALPHAQPAGRRVSEGDLIVFDFGAAVDGYGSDMTRTILVGGEPTDRQRHLYGTVLAAQEAGVAAVGDGVPTSTIDAVCREVIESAGLGDAFIHGTGHSLGLEIHESPFLSASDLGVLAATMVVTVEPGIYLPGECGIRIEDTVLVEPEGARRLTKSSKAF